MATGAWVEDIGGGFGGFYDARSIVARRRRRSLGGDDAEWDEERDVERRGPFRVSLGDAPSVLVGRGQQCGLCVASEPASRVHARIVRHDGGWWISDSGSTGGTFVERRRIKRHCLADGQSVLLVDAAHFRVRIGDVDDVGGAGCSIGGRYLFARTWPSSRHFQSVVVYGNTVELRAASFVPRDVGRVFASSRSVLHDDGVATMLVEAPDADGPTLLHIANATKEVGASIDDEVLGAVVAALPGYANELHEVAVTWSGDVAVLGVPELRTQMQHNDWFALRLRELGYPVTHWHLRTPRERNDDRALLAGFVARLFPDDARRAQERRDQILLRSAEDWRTAITRWRL